MHLIDWKSGRFLLGNPVMDATHIAFATLVNRLAVAGDAEFTVLFAELFDHTGDHFAREDTLMLESGFPAIEEHRAEHRRVLGEMRQLGQRVAQGRAALARSYVMQQLPGWFAVHAATMDSALAAHLAMQENSAAASR